MAEIKVNIGDAKSKKTYNKTLSEEQLTPFIGKKIGDKVGGEALDLAGYEFEIRGGSDSAGFPMRKDVQGSARKKILIVGGVGMRNQHRKGLKLRKMVAGNTIYEKTAQINLAVTKHGKGPIQPVAEVPATEDEEKKAE
ncbi:30S ribosomal protein S6e [Candidatus Woesearchaeota archaeon]|nr:30S ribosomal protein S6e [Candidatus Woesearchaeota archaeon]